MKWFTMLVLMIGSTLLAGCQLGPRAAELPEKPARIAFMSNRDTNFEIYIMDRDGQNVTRVTDGTEVNKLLPAWSSRARTIAYLEENSGSQEFSIYLDNDSGSNKRVLTDEIRVPPGPVYWSPTGEWLALGVGRGEDAEVYVVNANGEQVVNVSNSPGEDLFGGWSPDGKELLYVSDRDGRFVVYMANVEGGESMQLTNPTFDSGRPLWSPDGGHIAFMTNRDGNIEIYSMNTEDGETIRLTDAPGFDGFPLWSPTGDKIAFLTDRDGNAEIYVMNADGTDPVNITNMPRSQESTQGDFSWSPDGEQIMFHSDITGNLEVYVVDANGENQVNLTNDDGIDFASVWVK